MALTPQENRQLLMDLVSGRISKKEYDEVLYSQRVRDLRIASNQAPSLLTETEKRLFSRAKQTTQPTLPTVNDQGVIDVSSIDTTTRGSTTNQFGTPPQDLDKPSLGDIYAQGGGIGTEDPVTTPPVTTPPVTTPPVTETPDEYGYTPSQYKAGIAIYRKDAPAGGERVFSNADLKQALNNGYSLTPVNHS